MKQWAVAIFIPFKEYSVNIPPTSHRHNPFQHSQGGKLTSPAQPLHFFFRKSVSHFLHGFGKKESESSWVNWSAKKAMAAVGANIGMSPLFHEGVGLLPPPQKKLRPNRALHGCSGLEAIPRWWAEREWVNSLLCGQLNGGGQGLQFMASRSRLKSPSCK